MVRFQQFADDEGLPSLQSMFVLALRMYMAKVNGRTDDVMVGVNVGRRGSREERLSGGSRAQHLRFRTILPEMTFLEALRVLAERQSTFYRHVDFPCYLLVTDDDGSGALRCYWERNIRHVPVETIERCHDFMVRAMRAGVERPTITLGEIMDLP